MPWRRPVSVPLGTVWRRFQGREKADGSRNRYMIQDVLESDVERCIDFQTKAFLRDEPLCHVLDTSSDEISVRTIQNNWREYLKHQVALACYVEKEDGKAGELVAFNLCLIKSKNDAEEDFDQVEGDSWKKVLKTLILAEETCDVFAKYGVEQYFTCSGLCVLPEHRGQNIGLEMLRAREPLCRALGITATATVFTAMSSQVLAAKCGYEVLGELPYETMLVYGIDLSECDTPSAKHMGTKFRWL